MVKCQQCNDLVPPQYIIYEKELGAFYCYRCYSNMPRFRTKGYEKKIRKIRRYPIN